MDMQALTLYLNDTVHEGRRFYAMPIEGKEAVLQINVSDVDEIPVYLTVTETQTLCLAYLFDEGELRQDRLPELLDSMLRLSIPMPLSAIGKIEHQYVVHGALAPTATYQEIAQEIAAVADNTADLLDTFEEFLQ